MNITDLFVQYIRASPKGRLDLVASNNHFFTPDVVEALDAAHSVLLETQQQSKEVCHVIDGAVNDVDLPLVPRVTLKESADLALTEDAMIERFAEQMVNLLSQQQIPDFSPHVSSLLCGDVQGVNAPWHRHCQLVLYILSFLPAECIFNVAENVCRAWREWLYLHDVSKAFWLGCVQREFLERLRRLLLQNSDVCDLYTSDWRTIAMEMCCTDDEESVSDGMV